jgi:hypothetical protein
MRRSQAAPRSRLILIIGILVAAAVSTAVIGVFVLQHNSGNSTSCEPISSSSQDGTPVSAQVEQNPAFKTLEQGRNYVLTTSIENPSLYVGTVKFTNAYQMSFACPPYYIYVTVDSNGNILQLLRFTYSGNENDYPSYCGQYTTWTILGNASSSESTSTFSNIATCT